MISPIVNPERGKSETLPVFSLARACMVGPIECECGGNGCALCDEPVWVETHWEIDEV